MASTLALVIAAIVAAFIQRPRRPDEVRWHQTYLFAWFACVALLVLGPLSIVERGHSRTSLAIACGTFILCTSALLVLLVDIYVADVPDAGGWRWVGLRRPHHDQRRHRLTLIWIVCALWFALAPLRYVGAFADSSTVTTVVAVLTAGQFEALAEPAAIAAGQCMDARKPSQRNLVVPCAEPHRAEVVDAVNSRKECPTTSDVPRTGLDVVIEAVGPFDGTVYCVLTSTGPTRRWTGPAAARVLAHTL